MVIGGGIAVLAGVSYVLAQSAAERPGTAPAPSPAVRTIALPQVAAPDLPDGPGLETFNIACTLCHSARYLTMQPRFSQKVWEAELDKMKKTYGAPFTDEQGKQVLQFLLAVRGPEPADARR